MVRYTPYEITFDNYESFLLEEHHLHNCIIYLFALTELYLNGICDYLDSISDPTYAFVELMARYSNFRSFVMEFEVHFLVNLGKFGLHIWKLPDPLR